MCWFLSAPDFTGLSKGDTHHVFRNFVNSGSGGSHHCLSFTRTPWMVSCVERERVILLTPFLSRYKIIYSFEYYIFPVDESMIRWNNWIYPVAVNKYFWRGCFPEWWPEYPAFAFVMSSVFLCFVDFFRKQYLREGWWFKWVSVSKEVLTKGGEVGLCDG